MATFDQRGQTVGGNQVNADSVDLRGADLRAGVRAGDRDESVRDIEAVLAVLHRAARDGLIDPAAADRAAGELGSASADVQRGNPAAAATRVERAVKVLESAAPMAAIAGTLASVWQSISGMSG